MRKILFLIFTLSIGVKSYAYDDNFPAISSDQFSSVDIGSTTVAPVVAPSTVIFSNIGIRQINYSNPSSSSTLYFGTAPANATSLTQYGFPLYPLQSISVDRDPYLAFQSSISGNTMLYWTRGVGDIGVIPLKVWIRYSR